MSKENKKSQDMSVEEILKSIKGVINERKNFNNDDDILELTEVIDEDEEDPLESDDEERLISVKSATETGDIFKNFADVIKDKNLDNAASSKNALEELIIKMLKPELKQWLDENLPSLVKELVEREIKKLILNSKK